MGKKQTWRLIILILLVLGLTGCYDYKEAVQRVTPSRENAIPLIMMASESSGGDNAGSREKALLGHWDIEQGKFSLNQQPLFFKETASEFFPRLIWDGGAKLFACSFGTQASEGLVKGKTDAVSIKDIKVGCKPIFVPLQGMSRQGELLLAYPRAQSVDPGNSRNSWSSNDIIIEIIHGNKVQKTPLQLPDYVAKGEIAPLLISGSAAHFTLLVFYNDVEAGKNGLLIADVKGKQVAWKQMEGTGAGLIAGGGADLAQNGEKIFVSEPVLSVIDLKSKQLKLQEFKMATAIRAGINQNIAQANDKYGDIWAGTHLGSYGDTLLMAVDLPDEHWIWAFRDEKCIGSLYFNNESKSICISRGNRKAQSADFSSQANGFILPADAYGQYK